MTPSYSDVHQAVEAIGRGEIVIVVDSDEREDEGDFLVAADKITPKTIHFMLREARGQLCVPVLREVADRLALAPMVESPDNRAPGFTVPVDHRSCKTGVSPLERCRTILAMIDEASRPIDFDRPGHVFPLVAKRGGVLERPGHTEAAIELTRLAGLNPAGVLCEICSRDGMHMAGRAELLEMASDFGLCMLEIDNLAAFLRHRNRRALAIDSSGCCSAAVAGRLP